MTHELESTLRELKILKEVLPDDGAKNELNLIEANLIDQIRRAIDGFKESHALRISQVLLSRMTEQKAQGDHGILAAVKEEFPAIFNNAMNARSVNRTRDLLIAIIEASESETSDNYLDLNEYARVNALGIDKVMQSLNNIKVSTKGFKKFRLECITSRVTGQKSSRKVRFVKN